MPILFLLLFCWVTLVYGEDNKSELVDSDSLIIIQAKEAANNNQWQSAEKLYKKAWVKSAQNGQTQATLDILFSLLTVYQQQSDGVAAFGIAEEIEKLVVNLSDPFSLTRSYRLLGIAYQALANNELARDYYSVAVEFAREIKKPALLASLLNELGYSDVLINDYISAKASFKESYTLARSLNNLDLMLQAQINLIRVQIALGNKKNIKQNFALLENLIDEIPESEKSMEKIISMGTLYRTAQIKLKLNSQYRKKAYLRYERGLNLAKNYQNIQLQSIANGYIGQIYSDEKQYETAGKFTQEAIELSQNLNNLDLTYRWTVQLARIFSAQNKKELAFKQYKNAIEQLDTLDVVNFMRYERSFNADVKPVFEEMMTILFQQVRKTKSSSKKKIILNKIVQYIENLRIKELSAFCFGNCNFKNNNKKIKVPKKEAVLYAFVTKINLYVILNSSSGIYYKSHSVTRKTLLSQLSKLRKNIQKANKSYLKQAKIFHKWFVSPFNQPLKNQKIQTISIVPSQELMTLPFDVLYEKNRFLIENFSIKLVKSAADTHNAINLKSNQSNIQLTPEDNIFVVKEKISNANSKQILAFSNRVSLANDYRQSKITTDDENYPMFSLLNKVNDDKSIGGILLSHHKPDAVNNIYFNGLMTNTSYFVAPLWSYSIEAKQVLLSTFYSSLRTENPAISLQKAKIALIHDKALKHPKNWAGMLILQH